MKQYDEMFFEQNNESGWNGIEGQGLSDEELNALEEALVKEQQEDYLLPVSYDDFLEDLQSSIFGQDETLEDIAYDIYTYLNALFDGRTVKHNFIIAGPSASGKTELYRTVKRLLKEYQCPVPVLHTDMSSFSPTGFQGAELSNIAEVILNADSYGYAIMFLDEFDKILTPLYSSNHENFNEVLQHEMLTLIEGREFQVKRRGITYTVDTGKTLFIAMGAFSDYRKSKAQNNPRVAGFMASNEEIYTNKIELLAMEDLLKVGGMVELLGRFDCIYNFGPIREDVFGQLFERMVLNLGIEQQVLIIPSDDAIDEFSKLSKSDYGCREVKRKLYETIKPCLKRIAGRTDRIKLRILVDGIGKAKVVEKKG